MNYLFDECENRVPTEIITTLIKFLVDNKVDEK
jgi:hypothetical protein